VADCQSWKTTWLGGLVVWWVAVPGYPPHSAVEASRCVPVQVRTCLQIHLCEGEGDILLFLTGEQEIEQTCTQVCLLGLVTLRRWVRRA
jgi:hypothetical protein